MPIKDNFVPVQELLDLFGVQRNATLKRMLEKNNIPYILDYKKNPLVLRTALDASGLVPPEPAVSLSWDD